MKIKRILFLLSLILINFLNVKGQPETSEKITAEDLKLHLTYLASDELKGRYSGSEECRMAALYIAKEFEKFNLKPLFGNDYFQEFPFVDGVEFTANNSLVIKTSNGENVLTINEDFVVAPFSDRSDLTSNLVFAGYGISAPDLNYDDYAGIDVKGKVVLIMRNNPEYNLPHSKFENYSALRFKVNTAREKGAAGVIFVNGYEPKDELDKFIDVKYDRGGFITGISAVQIKRNFVDDLFKTMGMDFAQHQKKINETKTAASFEFKDATVTLKTEIIEIEKTSWNVAGYIEGTDPFLKNEYLVIGAHFDHLGMGGENSLYQGEEKLIHNGADDNASGTSGLLELAEKFSFNPENQKRSIIFVAFSGEELGVLGSNYFVNHSPVPSGQMITMLNMDMIGRLNEKKQLIVYGTGTSNSWKDLLNKYNHSSFELTFNDEGYGPSDHTSFYGKQIPVLFFFTGTHEDYHKPSDDVDKINFEGQQQVVQYVYDLANEINNSSRPNYLVVQRKEQQSMTRTKVWVGTIPDFAGNVDGYKLSGVTDNSPAQIAGLKAGDIIIKFGEKKISNIYDFTYAIGEHSPGEKVNIVVLRDGKEMSFEIELGSR
jgi:hypothetical protein